jgi:hypothetical protein
MSELVPGEANSLQHHPHLGADLVFLKDFSQIIVKRIARRYEDQAGPTAGPTKHPDRHLIPHLLPRGWTKVGLKEPSRKGLVRGPRLFWLRNHCNQDTLPYK